MKRILVIEPEWRARHALRTMLEDAGYEVELADDGSDAARSHSVRPADLVIADGFDTPPRATFAGARLLAVPGACSGRKGQPWADALLPKPFRRHDLLAAVRASLEAARPDAREM